MATIDKHYTRKVAKLAATATCGEAARLMRERRIGSVAVMEGERTVGLVTERDLVQRVLAEDGTADQPLARALRSDLPSLSPDSSDEECAALMRDHNTRHLLVEKGGEVVGIISMKDVIQLMLDEKQFLVDQLQGYISRA